MIVAGSLVLALCAALFFAMGMAFFQSLQPRYTAEVTTLRLREVPSQLRGTVRNHLSAMKNGVSLERLHLDIKFKALEKLRAKRAEAIRLGTLIAADDDFVPATIRHEGRSIKTQVRLKGDLLDHLYGDKWSFRVEVKKDDQLLGMRRFSLQSPSVRDNQAEPVFLGHLRREGVLTPRYRFVDVTMNGRDIGVMAIEEHFSKELLESQRRKEGVILRFDESPFWMNRSLNGTFGPFANPRVAMVSPFQSGKIAKSPLLSSDLTAAVGLMRGFLEGELTAADVFDVELMARFLAVVEVWQAHHALAWHNLRFYFNPLTARLEPVGFDGHLQARTTSPGMVVSIGDFTPFLLDDPEFRSVFIRNLARIAGEMADGTIADWAREQERDLLPVLQEGLEYLPPLRIDSLMTRARDLARIDEATFQHYLPPLGSPDMQYPEPVKVYLCSNCVPTSIEFVNALPVPVMLLSLAVTEQTDAAARVAEALEAIDLPIEIEATEFQGAPKTLRIALDTPLDAEAPLGLEAVVRVSGQEQRHTVRAEYYSDRLERSPVPAVSLSEALGRHPFLVFDEESESLRADPGVWDVDGSLIIPEGMALVVSAGTELRFGEGEALISSGPLLFQGAPDQPITFRPRPGTSNWAGIASLRTDAPHVWSHVIVESTTGIAHPGWRLTGGVTLRAARVEISDSIFRGHRGEDALNLIRSEIELENVEFHDAPSDALDADFSNGVIRGGRYSKIGGDGIDVSGAEIEVFDVELTEIADKAISVGEGSRVSVRNVRIEHVGTGAASKDRSELIFEDSFIGDAMTAGVSVYTKKPEYGPASAIINNVEMRSVGIPVLVQIGSQATIDGESVTAVPIETKSLY
jgi:hypothetical protein